jgi:hypothetical protein
MRFDRHATATFSSAIDADDGRCSLSAAVVLLLLLLLLLLLRLPMLEKVADDLLVSPRYARIAHVCKPIVAPCCHQATAHAAQIELRTRAVAVMMWCSSDVAIVSDVCVIG